MPPYIFYIFFVATLRRPIPGRRHANKNSQPGVFERRRSRTELGGHRSDSEEAHRTRAEQGVGMGAKHTAKQRLRRGATNLSRQLIRLPRGAAPG